MDEESRKKNTCFSVIYWKYLELLFEGIIKNSPVLFMDVFVSKWKRDDLDPLYITVDLT